MFENPEIAIDEHLPGADLVDWQALDPSVQAITPGSILVDDAGCGNPIVVHRCRGRYSNDSCYRHRFRLD